MSTPRSRRHREVRPTPRPTPRGDGITLRQWLREVSRELDYLAWKESTGEPLSGPERALLDAHRRGGASAALLGAVGRPGPGGGP